MSEQWQGDWMRDRETGQLIDGPALSRYQMFMLIRELRAVIRTHAKSIRDKDAVIKTAGQQIGVLEGALESIQALDFKKTVDGRDDFYSGAPAFIRAWITAYFALVKYRDVRDGYGEYSARAAIAQTEPKP